MKNSTDNVFAGIPVAGDADVLASRFLGESDFAPATRRAFLMDYRKFGHWFVERNHEPLRWDRVTARDLSDFRDYLRRDRQQAVATINRSLVALRRLLGWLAKQNIITANVGLLVKELRQQTLAPKGLDVPIVRRLLREVELRGDVRAAAIFSLMLFTGARVGDVVNLELDDLVIGDRSGHAVFRNGKGGKQRTVPLPQAARQTMTAYIGTRPPLSSNKVFIGERGPLTDQGIRSLCSKYGAMIGTKIHPHLFRHTMAHQFLKDNSNDLVALAQVLGHGDVNTTARYTKRSQADLAQSAERIGY